MAEKEYSQSKRDYFEKVHQLVEAHTKIFVVTADNVGSHQLQQTRVSLRGKATILMGKNTLVVKSINAYLKDHPNHPIRNLIPHIKNNIGLVFVKSDMNEVKAKLLANKIAANAKQGAISPVEVKIPAGNTGMEPTKTSFFQALSIPTKITKGSVEIINDVTVLKVGQKVGNSEAALLQMMGIKPFSYGLGISHVYEDGEIYGADVLDITNETLAEKFASAVATMTAVSLGAGVGNVLTVPHLIREGFSNILSLALASENISFPEAEKVKEMLKNPGAFAAAAPAATSAAPAAASAAAPAAAAPADDDDDDGGDMGFGLFD